MPKNEELKNIIFKLIKRYYELEHKHEAFIPGETYIPYSGRVYDEQEMINIVDSALDFWLTMGRFSQQFEREFSGFLGSKHCILANSGSSANLLAISALTSSQLGEERLLQGDEVITNACAFPTTVNPIIQNNLVPVFVDVELGTYNIDSSNLEGAISKKTKAIFLAHTLGNPFELDKIMDIANEYGLWIVEDSCDSLGSKYNNRYTGTFGHVGTFSFYPAHHITMGEGGACVTNDTRLKRLIESFRDWGRDCWCNSGCDNTCGKRFGWTLGKLPTGYDHKYIYSNIGYNLKITDMQAAIGVAQIKKLDSFIEARKRNWSYLYSKLKRFEDIFILPKILNKADPCWFGFPLTIKNNQFNRTEITNYLESKRIATRSLFSGNILRHPSFEGVKSRTYGDLKNTNYITENTFWIGIYPGISIDMLDYMVEKFEEFLNS